MNKNLLNKLLEELRAYKSSRNVFNPWRDYDRFYDIGPQAPGIRLEQLEQFLCFRIPSARYLLVAEAISYQGGRFTGIPLTSERIILGNHQSVKYEVVLQNSLGRRTSNANNGRLKDTQRRLGFTEPTATIVWGEIIKNKIPPERVVTWNIFPFHPFKQDQSALTNRTPTPTELAEGSLYTQALLRLCPDVTVISIGALSSKNLDKLGIQNIHVPHPANGGAGRFRAATKSVFLHDYKSPSLTANQ